MLSGFHSNFFWLIFPVRNLGFLLETNFGETLRFPEVSFHKTKLASKFLINPDDQIRKVSVFKVQGTQQGNRATYS